MNKTGYRDIVPIPPEGIKKLQWYGPGLLWMLSAVGTGSILFTPRVASVYEYQLFWLLAIVVIFMWVMIREMGRYSVVTGLTMLEGMHSLSGPKNWAIWIIFLPQLLAAAVGIAGLAAVTGSALASFLPGGGSIYALLIIFVCMVSNVSGQYMYLERLSRTMAILLLIMVVIAAAIVFPDMETLATGMTLSWPENPRLYIILPWVGTILAGSMGIVWFGYWTATRGFGGGLVGRERDDERPQHQLQKGNTDVNDEIRKWRLRAWLRIMSGTATVGVVGGFVVIASFMVLGAELLAPQGILPEGTDVAVDLTRLFSGIWGLPGKVMLLTAIIIALGGSILANQDGWGRSFADMTLILIRGKRQALESGRVVAGLEKLERLTGRSVFNRVFLKQLYILSITGIVPIIIILLFRDPVEIMSASGIIAAAHTPFIVLISLYVNRTRLPDTLRPGIFNSLMMAAAGIFYLTFALFYFRDLVA